MIEKVFRKVNAGRLIRKVRSESELETILPLDQLRKFSKEAALLFEGSHREYITHISSPEMASSLELATLFYSLCRLQSSRKILDLGSGYSSLVSRSFAKGRHGTECWSVDDDGLWLQKTIEYLHRRDVDTTHCYSLDSFLATRDGDFDLVLLDLNFVEVREKFIQQTIDRCRKGGWILFDDVHKSGYRYEVLKQSNGQVVLYDLRSLTEDRFGRYTFLGVKK